MKKLLLILFAFILSINVMAQCDYADDSDAPEELFRKRVDELGMRYGNPYTMFVRGDNFNLAETLVEIRKNIKDGEPIDGVIFLNEYAKLYAEIYNYAHNNAEPNRCPTESECDPHAGASVRSFQLVIAINCNEQKI